MSKFVLVVIAASSTVFLATGGHTLIPDLAAPAGPQFREGGKASARCDIKGNISIDTGERIYHVPGQHYYPETKISARYGERWFCSEEEARAAGWRRARR